MCVLRVDKQLHKTSQKKKITILDATPQAHNWRTEKKIVGLLLLT